ncbi:MAG: GNAT family N-acetyltransferase [Phycisphaerales bacterium]|nr:GNAT family N-acetyltransferase [Phycisphaerales bacterium]
MQILQTLFHSDLGQQAAQLRTDVFVHEQHVPPDEELDHLDATATHFVAVENGHVIATLRIVFMISDGESVAKIGRVAVAKNRRNTGIGRNLMLAAIAHLRDQGCHQCLLNAQTHVISFYEKLGFIPHGPIFLEANIPHRHMILTLHPPKKTQPEGARKE